MVTTFYEKGLLFSCTRCSSCCRYESGYVFLSQEDLLKLADYLKLGSREFIHLYCRWVPGPSDTEQLSLKEKSNKDCIFWNDGCTVYEARPLQCQLFPFWDIILSSAERWRMVSQDCPGMNQGRWYSPEEIEDLRRLGKENRIISRKIEKNM
ncbi:MAG TPA: YkgJ family cysteine cluster protein [Termitinemataceae bacterium]|nr:YkgJ family cysteine cluster protein [Termitinemataceae bacterium]HOM22362.1 YkgJ family cysteine cluster protein [Termitinemataceae bacterium]HPP99638.1 YkgJ family cysteine cluster protein [Termitinemataceae bacterium]